METSSGDEGLDGLSRDLIHEYWGFYPTAGSHIGRHEYDGRLPDLTPASLSFRAESVRTGLRRVSAIDSSGLTNEDRLSHRLLEQFLKRELFTLTEMRPLEFNPMRQVGYLDVGSYVRRDYAPLADRLRSASRVLAQVPEFLENLDATLSGELGAPVLEMSVEAYAGMARFYRQDLKQAVSGFDDPAILTEFNRLRESAAAAVDGFVDRLRARREAASPQFAIGARMYQAMMSEGEAVILPVEELERVGQANLDDNLARLAQVAAEIGPGRPVADIVAHISGNHPTADSLISDTREMLEALRQSMIDLDILSVPSEDRCQVMETPAYMRYAFAAMDSAGALETLATESFYYVTPVKPGWTPVQREEWLSNFNYDTLKIISIHEVYPGHFVHHLHNKYGRDLPLVNRVATSYAFTEGWAHYTEEMVVDTDYAKGQPNLLLTQLLEALVRNCRYLCSIRMHTQGMTVDQATRFFTDNAYMGELPARREALRGTFDPGYLNYTLGKLMIKKLARDYQREKGGAFSLKEFHDRLLSYGAPALPLVREVMLENPEGSPV